MKYERTKEGYAEYLKSDHWKTFRREVLKRDNCRCRRCGKFGWQVHHKFYRDDWETAQLSDCVTVCRKCHEEIHSVKPADVIASNHHLNPPVSSIPVWTFEKILEARNRGLLTRREFLELRSKLGIGKKRKWVKRKIQPEPKRAVKIFTYIPSGRARKPYKHRYVNRGTSSN